MTAIITGAGPGVSGSFARVLAADGHDLGLLGVDHGPVEGLADGLGGTVDVLHFNPSAFREKDPLELTVAELLDDVALGVGALLTVVQAVRPYLSAGARVTVT